MVLWRPPSGIPTFAEDGERWTEPSRHHRNSDVRSLHEHHGFFRTAKGELETESTQPYGQLVRHQQLPEHRSYETRPSNPCPVARRSTSNEPHPKTCLKNAQRHVHLSTQTSATAGRKNLACPTSHDRTGAEKPTRRNRRRHRRGHHRPRTPEQTQSTNLFGQRQAGRLERGTKKNETSDRPERIAPHRKKKRAAHQPEVVCRTFFSDGSRSISDEIERKRHKNNAANIKKKNSTQPQLKHPPTGPQAGPPRTSPGGPP